jgi:protein-S-isoprenylcysteine O-methyltransferase Ste14
MKKIKLINLLKSFLHNVGVLIVGFVVAFIGTRIDSVLIGHEFHSVVSTVIACLLLAAGFLLRFWATFYFYERNMKIIVLEPQHQLITTGPYKFSRNPLYLGGNGLIFFGACLLLGSPSGLVITALHLPLIDLFIRREEKQLQAKFGEEWLRYKKRVRRWI